jgi:hypothetical protein
MLTITFIDGAQHIQANSSSTIILRFNDENLLLHYNDLQV